MNLFSLFHLVVKGYILREKRVCMCVNSHFAHNLPRVFDFLLLFAEHFTNRNYLNNKFIIYQ